MYEDKTNKWLKNSIKAHRKVILDCYQYKYFMRNEEDFERAQHEIFDLVHEMKLMELELASRRGRL